MKADSAPPASPHGRLDRLSWVRDVARTPQKALGLATTLAALALIARLTLTPLGTTLPSHFDLCVPCGSTGTANFILNVILFIPLGLGLRAMGWRRWTAFTAALVLTIGIEALQFYVVPGRDSDLGDIVANAGGGAIGIAALDWRRLWLTPPGHLAGRLATAAAFLVCVGGAAVQWALAPHLPRTVYYEQIAPDLPGYSLFDGRVLDATFDGAIIGIGRMSTAASAAMRDSLLADSSTIDVTFLPGSPGKNIAPIVAVHDQRRREVFLLARLGDDLFFRMCRRTAVLGFHDPSTVLRGVFPADPGPGDTLAARVTIRSQSTTLDVTERGTSPARHWRQRVGVGLWDAWRFFIPDSGRWERHAGALTLLSMVLFFGPIGYWTGRAARHEGIMLSVSAIVIPIAACLAIIPWAAGALPGNGFAWAAALGGAAVAWGFGRWSVG